jgi:hypothetical protein
MDDTLMKFKRMFALLLLAMGLIVANAVEVSATTMNYQDGWLAKTTYPISIGSTISFLCILIR